MNRIHGAAVIGLTSLLSACCLWVPQHPPAPVDVLNPEHAFAQLPAGAEVVDVDTFLRPPASSDGCRRGGWASRPP